MNFQKPYISFYKGMKPVVLSDKSNKGWDRDCCFNVKYKQNMLFRRLKGRKKLFTLKF